MLNLAKCSQLIFLLDDLLDQYNVDIKLIKAIIYGEKKSDKLIDDIMNIYEEITYYSQSKSNLVEWQEEYEVFVDSLLKEKYTYKNTITPNKYFNFAIYTSGIRLTSTYLLNIYNTSINSNPINNLLDQMSLVVRLANDLKPNKNLSADVNIINLYTNKGYSKNKAISIVKNNLEKEINKLTILINANSENIAILKIDAYIKFILEMYKTMDFTSSKVFKPITIWFKIAWHYI